MDKIQISINHIGELEEYKDYLKNFNPDLCLLFGSFEFFEDNLITQELDFLDKKTLIAGCSTAGEIDNHNATEGSLVITAFKFDHTTLNQSTISLKKDIPIAQKGQELAQSLISKDKDIKGIIILSVGHQVNASEFIEYFDQEFRKNGMTPVIVGGLAGDNALFEKTYVCDTEGCSTGKITAISFSGEQLVFFQNSHAGWEPLGEPVKITKYHENVLQEVNGIPALDFYSEKLGPFAKQLPKSGLLFPFFMFNEKEEYIRTPLSVNMETKEVTLAGSVPENSHLKLMRASTTMMFKDVNQNVYALKNKFITTNSQVGAIIVFSCVGRKMLLGSQLGKEFDIIKEKFAHEMIAGFYTYGEIGEVDDIVENRRKSCIHNQTLTLVYIGESDA